MEKMSVKSLDLLEKNIDIIQKTFPEVMTEEEFNGKVERKIDFDKLRLLLGDDVSDREERYELRWNGKNDAIRFAQTPSSGTLRPDKESSKNWDDTENLYIEGDNLEVLKLLEKSYFEEIKMIYIDPPYNTGKDFVYKDDFRDNVKNYLEQTGQSTMTNTESNGRYHTDWLNMMYPRLKIAKNLLSDDGVIFISIDDNESANAKKICDEIFGENNFCNYFIWTKTSTPPSLSHKCRKTVEYILCYEKNKNNTRYFGSLLSGGDAPLLNTGNNIKELIFPKGTVYFNFKKNGEITSGKYEKVELMDNINIIDGLNNNEFRMKGEFKWGQELLNEEILKGTYFIIKTEKLSIRFKRVYDENNFKTPNNFLNIELNNELGIGTNESAVKELDKLKFYNVFDFPKPVSLIKYLVNMITKFDKDSIIMDFFSGSATTAHAVMQLNAEDGGNRKFIMVQLPEITPEKSEARNAGYENICEIGKERIRRAGDMIVNENKDKEGIEDLDIGFKLFKLDSSNIKEWNPEYENIDYALYERVDVVKMGRTNEDLLYEIIIKMGVEPTVYIEEIKVGDKIIYNIGMGILLICLEDEITDEIIDEILNRKSIISSIDKDIKTKVVFKESGFIRDSDKINAIQKLKQFGITEVRSV